MNIVLMVLVIAVTLFVLAFLTKRRFGVLGLALTAGAMLSSLWTADLAPALEQSGIVTWQLPLEALASAVLILLPAALLLFSGPSYHNMSLRIVGAASFALLATVLLIEPIGSTIVLMDQGKDIYDWLLQNQVYIITVGILLAVVDLLSVHTGIGGKPRRGRNH